MAFSFAQLFRPKPASEALIAAFESWLERLTPADQALFNTAVQFNPFEYEIGDPHFLRLEVADGWHLTNAYWRNLYEAKDQPRTYRAILEVRQAGRLMAPIETVTAGTLEQLGTLIRGFSFAYRIKEEFEIRVCELRGRSYRVIGYATDEGDIFDTSRGEEPIAQAIEPDPAVRFLRPGIDLGRRPRAKGSRP